MARHLFLLPSLGCPSACRYCFGPREGVAVMEPATVDAIVRWQGSKRDGGPLEITFHGGEPLVTGARFYRDALPRLSRGLAPQRVQFAVQSNLWLLTDELCQLFRRYRVALSTSLDGPQAINDAQRGAGYFQRTMAGIEKARSHGLDVGCICTFTAQSAPHADEVFQFFLGQGLPFTVHAALPSLQDPWGAWILPPADYGELLVSLLERYLAHLERIRIGTLDSMARSVSAQQGGICTFGHCLGHYLAVAPDGAIYPCQRLAGLPEYALGHVGDAPSPEQLAATPVWRLFQQRQDSVKEECGGCPYYGFCRGGCPYNALAADRGTFRTLRDPHCPAYRRFFRYVTERALGEVFSPENLAVVVDDPRPERGLLRRGRLLSLMDGGPHPHETSQQARRVLAAVALAATCSPEEAGRRLQQAGLTHGGAHAQAALAALQRELTAPARILNNLYLHVTFTCNLSCTHCYAEAGPERREAMPVPDLVRACRQAAALGFRQAVVTGGEPLLHPRRDDLLDALAALRGEVKPLLTVLRTNLALPMSEGLLRRIGRSVDQVVVSLDGDRATHDARRGAGGYDRTVANLRALTAMGGEAELSLAAVLQAREVQGPPGDAVRALARELGIRRIRFRPLLPLGRAAGMAPDLESGSLWGRVDPRETLCYGFAPRASCGLGQNLYVGPDGASYPCYAWCGEGWNLGNLSSAAGLSGVVGTTRFQDLGRHTVDSNRRCRRCALRYLCGGACRAWNGATQEDLGAPPAHCEHLHHGARSTLVGALAQLSLPEERWLEARLPLPAGPPPKDVGR